MTSFALYAPLAIVKDTTLREYADWARGMQRQLLYASRREENGKIIMNCRIKMDAVGKHVETIIFEIDLATVVDNVNSSIIDKHY